MLHTTHPLNNDVKSGENLHQSILRMAEEMGYDSIVNFSASINPYYSLWRKEIKLLLDGVVSNGQGAKKDELFVSQFHFDSKLNALFDLDEKIYRVLSNPKLIEFKKYVSSKELDFLTEQQHLMKLILSQLVRIVEESLVTCKNLHSEANTRSEYPVSFGLGPFLLDLGKCGESTLNPQNLQSPSTSFTDGQSDAADFEEGREVCSTGRVPHLDVFERAYISMHGNELSDEISLIVSYADVLRRRVTSALDSLNALQLRVLADAENETTNLEVEKSASESLGSLILGTSDPVHQSSKQDKVNKTLMVLDMLTMHNFRKLPSVAQLRTLEYEASSILKDKSDPRIEVGETPSKLDSMMEAFVRQCWRKRTHVIVLNANPILLQFCADSLLGNLGAYGGQNADCRTEVEKAQHRFCLTPRQSVALGVLAILFRYQSNMDKIETDKLKQMLLLVISPSSASTGLDLIRGFACCQCLARTNDAHSSFGSEVLEFALNHISSPSITWGLAAEICGCFAAFCQTQTFSELGVVTSRFREISCATVRILDYLGAPANTRRIASLILCEYGIRALESISNVNQLLAISIVEQGGVEVIIRVMSRPEARPAVVIECGLFVWKLVLASSSARVSVPSASACVASLMDIVSRPKCSCDVLDAVFKDLAAFTFDNAGLSQQVDLHLSEALLIALLVQSCISFAGVASKS